MTNFRITLDPLGAVVTCDREDDAAIALISHLMDKYDLSIDELDCRMIYPRARDEFASLRIDEELNDVAPR